MPDLQTCRNRILDALWKTGDYTSQTHVAIDTAIDYYKQKLFWFNEERATNNTTANTEYYDLPKDFQEVISLNININNNVYPLIRRTHEQMEALYIHASNYTGEPQDYEIIRDELRLGPVPGDARTMTMVYVKNPETLSGETSTNIFLTHAEPMIRYKAAGDLSFTLLKDQQQAQGFWQLASNEFINNKAASNRRNMRGSGKRRR